ncbi:succinate-semialdehyde dehydrogenase (NADP(+)) [Rhodococcus sp. BP-149]|jgi:succinate-semialdehyde dehydrogenase/glutarate-semialdehyde dehydrogenase|uniref:succinic semialdehyde dehydrogenase n=1 Tax=unclassified Rhodococcus (in: high G+C Gram-positive bacteria) TaxID=192944 RepID=UPI0006FF06D0|nr:MULTISPECIES: succinic semialdehyde dehydrogenase [unclassified Rhodococcus (in: high G+C Gram-positive bacteria)]KQU36573.1 succinate-semialdehyde dehydrogenase [Rhodococcus sp. Leaf225]KQU49078.1 succinate-semialdehyde dehydrogenase [Rhodococcus sp. Leaf258]MBY6687857.1 succinate-semialdehyde dehydrogenase (NADP(+)) [Rhodococcus sp. BP-288]MBY6696204.1 succinate-semialdehyde dehydrogenase (NADP(+)) [Rhodococcus sp. BP-188]MBY6700790.1 succinate-semialdehyde dehydrogenase (NADP(+)) [Rhodoc
MSAPTADTFTRLVALASVAPGRETKPVIEVFTGREMATIPVGTRDDVLAANDKVRAAQKRWATTSIADRAKILHKYRDLVLKHRASLIDLAQAETGKSRSAAQEEVLDIAMTARHYARVSGELLKSKRVKGMLPVLTKTQVNYQPKGIVGIISPWNYPMTLAVSDAIPALMAGNGIVLKPDSQTPYCALACVELLYQAGLPRDLFAVVPGPGSVVGTAIVDTSDYLMFTGSTATGQLLAEQTGRRLIGFSAELGGKNAMIVAAGAKIPEVVDAAVRACFSNSGQLCISIERIYVEKSIADKFTAAFGERVRRMTLAATYEFGVEMGSLISEDQVKAISNHVDDARVKGATVVAGGKARPDIGPLFYEPTVLTGVTDDMECWGAETFGPLVSIYPVASVDEAVERANATEYGLNASVWAKTKAQGEAIAARLHAGTVNVDEGYAPTWGSTGAPMGGMGVSGVGRRHGPDGVLKYTESQTVSTTRLINLGGRRLPPKLWAKTLPIFIRALKYVPGR